MNRANSPSWLLSAAVLTLGLVAAPASSQITPDATLPNNSVVLPNGNLLTIEGGTEAGTNLFHSFQEFSIPTGSEAFFNNALTIDNIITRVTGGSLSDIDGLIRANGTANLFLINPNGIQFGPNASLDIGGSFLGSTADSLLFEDGSFFSATEPNTPPLLTINVPTGLQFGNQPGTIQVNDAGQQGFDLPGTFSPRLAPGVEFLQVQTGNTLALIGGNIELTGGLIAAPQGRIELGSVAANTFVPLQAIPRGYAADYSGVNRFGDIRITQASAVNASGNGGGDIQIQGRQVRVSDGSLVQGNTKGSDNGGTMIVRASDLLEVIGGSGVSRITSSVAPNATGNAGAVLVEADRLRMLDAGQIGSGTFGLGDANSVTVRARDIEMSGEIGTFPSNITSPTGFGLDNPIGQRIKDTSTGNSGNISIEAERLRLSDGAQISAITFIQGNAGTISIVAERLEILGINEETEGISGVFSTVNPGAVGQGGDIVLNVNSLLVADGGAITSSSLGVGNAGNVEIRAGEIEVREVNSFDNQFVSRIESRVVPEAVGNGGSLFLETDRLQVLDGGQITTSTEGRGIAGSIEIRAGEIDVMGISTQGSFPSQVTALSSSDFDAGSIAIATDRLSIRDGAEISVSNTGGGNAGNLNVTARDISLDERGSLQAEGGTQGNITLDTADLRLRRGSNITTNATGDATGGNINIDTETLVALENSDISANAEQSFGGQVNISADGIFGTQFRDAPTPESDITATSALGAEFSGIVQIQTPDVDAASGLVALDGDTLNPDTQVSDSCEIATRSRFAITGNGGLPADPTEFFRGRTVWRDTRLGEIQSNLTPNPTEAEPEEAAAPTAPLVEATGWRRNDEGQIELVVASGNPSHSSWQPHPECNSSPHNRRS